MRSLIDAGKRLLLFPHGDGMQVCKGDVGDCGDVLYTFDYFDETKWGDVDTCDARRNGNWESAFFLVNHWRNTAAGMPSASNAGAAVALGALRDRFWRCRDKVPNVVAIDFWDVGDVFAFAREMNLGRAGGVAAAAEARSGADGG